MTREELIARWLRRDPIQNREQEMITELLDYIDTQVTLAGVVTNLPTADPEVEGHLWNENGTVKVSEGAP